MLLNCIIFPSTFVFLCLYPTSNAAIVPANTLEGCGAIGDCLSTPTDCQEKCGCDRAYYYNETTEECVLDIKNLMKALVTRYDIQEKIRLEADKLFKGIIITVLLFVACAILCVFSACVYCIHMKYTDCTLKNDVQALARKLHSDQKLKKCIVKPPRPPKEESCNVVVESAGVFVV